MGSTNVTKEVVELTAIDNATRVIQGVGSSVEQLRKTYDGLASQLRTLAGAFGVGYFASLVKSSIDANDHLEKLSKSTGITVENLAGLNLLAKQSGSDLDGLAKGVNKMSVEMGKDQEKFRALGITAKDNKTAFQQLADTFNLLSDVQQRNALAQAVFGKSWAEMAPALSEGGQKIGEIIERGTRLSGVSKEMTQQAQALNDKWIELSGTGGLLTRLVGPMLPLMNSLADDMLKAQEKTEGLNSSFKPLAESLKAVMVLGANVSFVFQTIGKDMARAFENVKLIARGDFAGSRALGETFRKDAAESRAALDAYEKKIMGLGLTGKPSPGASPADPAAASAASARAAAFLAKGKGAGGSLTPYDTEWNRLVDQLRQVQSEGSIAARVLQGVNAGDFGKLTDEQRKQLVNLAAQVEYRKQANELQKENDEIGKRAAEEANREAERVAALAEHWRQVVDPSRVYYQQIQQIAELVTAGKLSGDEGDIALAGINKQIAALQKMSDETKKVDDFGQQLGLTFASAAGKAITNFKNLSGVMRGLLADIGQLILKMTVIDPIEGMIKKAFTGFSISSLGSPSGFAGGGVMTSSGPMPLHSYAGGGIANTPQLAMFGDGSGPEAYVPLPDGRSIPVSMNRGGGGNVYIDATGADPAAIARLEALIRSVSGSIPTRSVDAVRRAFNSRGVSTALG